MTDAPIDRNAPRMRRALEEVKGLITSRYPSTTFAITRRSDLPGIRVLATVDVDDIDEVLDLYISGWPTSKSTMGCHFIPVQTPARLGRLLADHPAVS